MSNVESVITMKNVQKVFGKNIALKDVSCNVHKGEIFGLLGPSGSGKSTFLRCLNRLEEITAGDVMVNGHAISSKNANLNQIRQEVGMVFQQFNLFPHKKLTMKFHASPLYSSLF